MHGHLLETVRVSLCRRLHCMRNCVFVHYLHKRKKNHRVFEFWPECAQAFVGSFFQNENLFHEPGICVENVKTEVMTSGANPKKGV